ncbi:MAG: tRNA uridine-5-carboxymethylaminomethyl(34) synthesis GTPase MnmE [Allosphingosinicella sp.]
MTDTIFALSSGAPPAAIAVVRVSGPRAHAALEQLTGALPPPRRARLATLRHRDDVLDQALVLRFDGPRSETGEDAVELQLHGGRSVVAAVLAALATIDGLRPAAPGEFTRRAFENGRIDLSGAEGLADLLFSETQSQRRAALALAGGALGRQVEAWQAQLLQAAARIEALLDFSDEDDVAASSGQETGQADLHALLAEIEAFHKRPSIERLRDGLRVVIAGPTNAGKSSLLNVLAGREAAITSEIAGTTRDLVEAPTAIAGAPFLLVDTAGLRDSDDAIESIGVARARASLAAADLILWLGDPGDSPCPERSILIRPKADLGGVDSRADIAVSARTGEGVDALVALLVERAHTLLPADGEVAINARHRVALAEAAEWLREARDASDPLIIAEALRQARGALDRITGRAGVEDMLDSLFGRFCVGK